MLQRCPNWKVSSIFPTSRYIHLAMNSWRMLVSVWTNCSVISSPMPIARRISTGIRTPPKSFAWLTTPLEPQVSLRVLCCPIAPYGGMWISARSIWAATCLNSAIRWASCLWLTCMAWLSSSYSPSAQAITCTSSPVCLRLPSLPRLSRK